MVLYSKTRELHGPNAEVAGLIPRWGFYDGNKETPAGYENIYMAKVWPKKHKAKTSRIIYPRGMSALLRPADVKRMKSS